VGGTVKKARSSPCGGEDNLAVRKRAGGTVRRKRKGLEVKKKKGDEKKKKFGKKQVTDVVRSLTAVTDGNRKGHETGDRGGRGKKHQNEEKFISTSARLP